MSSNFLERAIVSQVLRVLDIWGWGEGISSSSFHAKPQGDIFFLSHQSATDIGQIQDLQLQLEEAKKEKQKLQEQVCAQSRHSAETKGRVPSGTSQFGSRKLSLTHSFIHSLNFSCAPKELRTFPADTHTHADFCSCQCGIQRRPVQ